MRVRILRQASGQVNGISLTDYKLGQVYDVSPTLADYLVAEELAMFEMRNPKAPPQPVEVERRKSSS
jgi:hypothetical protein